MGWFRKLSEWQLKVQRLVLNSTNNGIPQFRKSKLHSNICESILLTGCFVYSNRWGAKNGHHKIFSANETLINSRTSMISELDFWIFMLLVKILVSASQTQTTNYPFLAHHLHRCSTLIQGGFCHTRGRDATLSKRPKCNAATKHVAFGVTRGMLTFPRYCCWCYCTLLSWMCHFFFLWGLSKDILEISNWSGSRQGKFNCGTHWTSQMFSFLIHCEHFQYKKCCGWYKLNKPSPPINQWTWLQLKEKCSLRRRSHFEERTPCVTLR